MQMFIVFFHRFLEKIGPAFDSRTLLSAYIAHIVLASMFIEALKKFAHVLSPRLLALRHSYHNLFRR